MAVVPLTEDMMQSTSKTVKYPNPFFDLANTYIPRNIKTLFKFCRDYYKTTGWLRNVITKLATYPITDIVFDASTPSENKKILSEALNNKLKIKSFLIEMGLDYYTFGNTFVSASLKTRRFLQCTNCNEHSQFESVQKIRLRNYEFYGTCPVCGRPETKFIPHDEPIKSIENFKLVRWAPDNIDIDYNPITGTSIYYYNIPTKIKSQITANNPAILRDTPLVFFEALKNHKRIELEPSNLYHLKFPSIAEEDMGFGVPMILPALKEIYYLSTLRKGNEAIANEHVVPKKMLSPANTATIDPFNMMDMRQWKSEFEQTLKKWRFDPNYIGIFPIPVQYQELGGNAKMLMVTPELKFVEESIINSLGVPLEFIKGGTSWTGSSVSLRIVENGFLNYREFLHDFINFFVLPKLTSLLGYPDVKIKFKQFKMSDDSETKQLYINLNAAGKISDARLTTEFGFDAEEERQLIEKEQLQNIDMSTQTAEKQAEANGKAGIINAVYSVKAQKAAQDEMFKQSLQLFEVELANEHKMQTEQIPELLEKLTIEVSSLPPQIQQLKLMELRQKMPITFTLIMQKLGINQMPMPQTPSPQQGQGQPKDGEPPNQQAPGTREGDKIKISKDDAEKKHGPTKGNV